MPGRLRLTLSDGMLTAANTGAPLDANGVEALSTLRASGKRDDTTVGRFGVGFAATVAVRASGLGRLIRMFAAFAATAAASFAKGSGSTPATVPW